MSLVQIEDKNLEKIAEKLRDAANSIEEYLSQKELSRILNDMWNEGKRTLEIYYPEELNIGEKEWYADIYQDEIDKRWHNSWTWTVTSRKLLEIDIKNGERKETDIPEWEIIVDEPFSEEVIKNEIDKWLKERGYQFEIKLMSKEEAISSGNFFKDLEERFKEVESQEEASK